MIIIVSTIFKDTSLFIIRCYFILVLNLFYNKYNIKLVKNQREKFNKHELRLFEKKNIYYN